MLIYIWFRFKDIRFAASSVAALVHDVLVVLAFVGACHLLYQHSTVTRHTAEHRHHIRIDRGEIGLGIVLSMFTALFVTRWILRALFAVGLKDVKFYGTNKEKATVNFLGQR